MKAAPHNAHLLTLHLHLQIVMLNCQPNVLHHPNITEIRHDVVFNTKSKTASSKFNYRNNLAGSFAQLNELLPAMARKLYKVSSVMQLYEKRKEFDLIILDHIFNEVSVNLMSPDAGSDTSGTVDWRPSDPGAHGFESWPRNEWRLGIHSG